MGQSPESTSYNSDKQGVPFYQGNADFGALYPNPRIWCSKPIKLAKENDILISVRAPVGALNFSKEECCIGRGLAAITLVSNDFLIEFIYWSLRTGVKELQSKSTGSTFKSINKKVLEEVRIPIISLKDQEDIIRNITLLTNVLTKYKQETVFLDELVKARFVEMFGDPITNDMVWNTVKLNDVCDGIGDGLHGTPEYDEYGDYPFINGNNLKNGMIEITPSTKMVNEDTYRKHFIKLTKNAILLSINGTLGNLALYNGEKVMLGKSACYCNLTPDINRIFVCGIMKTDAFSNFLESNATSSTIKNIGLKAIREFVLIVPPLELQNQFASFVQEVDKSRSRIQKSLEASQELFDSLMQEYFG